MMQTTEKSLPVRLMAVVSLTKISSDRQVELIQLLRNEFEHSEEYKGKVESQWLMGVSLTRVSSRETSAEYLVRVTVKTSSSPYIDGMDIKIFLEDNKLHLEEDYFENTPELLGSPEEDAVKWHRKLGELIYLQLENPNKGN